MIKKNKTTLFIIFAIFASLTTLFFVFQRRKANEQDILINQAFEKWDEYKNTTNFSYKSITHYENKKTEFITHRDDFKTRILFYENDIFSGEKINTSNYDYNLNLENKTYVKKPFQTSRYIVETINDSISNPGKVLSFFMNNNELFNFNPIGNDPEIEGCEIYEIRPLATEEEIKKANIIKDYQVRNLKFSNYYLSISEETKKVCQFKLERKDIDQIEKIILDYSQVNIEIPK